MYGRIVSILIYGGNSLTAFLLHLQKNMSLFMLNGQPKDVLFAGGLKIGITTKSLSATGTLFVLVFLIDLYTALQCL